MKPVCRTIVTGVCLLVLADPAPALSPDRSVSTSRQFLVFGSDLRLRGAICDLAEGAKLEVLQLVGQRDAWSAPIVIYAHSPPVNLPETPRAFLSLGQTGSGLRLQLDLKMDSVSRPEIRRELLKAILLEMIYRHAPDLPAGTSYASPPDWLLDGVEARRGIDRWPDPASLEKAFSLADFLCTDPDSLDPFSRSLYRAYSATLIERLIHLPDGQKRLARFILDPAAAPDDGSTQFRKHFPEFSQTASDLQKVWPAQTVSHSLGPSRQVLSVAESEQVLSGMLRLRIPESDSGKEYELDEFPIFIKNVSAKRVLVRLRQDLRALVSKANPIYRPVICDYERTAGLLSRGKTNGIAGQLSRFSATRKMLGVKMRKINDYMNWFEAAKSNSSSGLFTDYIKAADLADSSTERRRDVISVYLDVVETQFQN